MKLSTRARYGLRAAVELALRGAWNGPEATAAAPPRLRGRSRYGAAKARRGGNGGRRGAPVPLAEVAKRQGISEQYLRQIFMSLRRAGVVEAVRGRRGGYLLAREPGSISALDVVTALGEEVEPVFCVGHPSKCRRRRECPTHPLWGRLAEVLREALGSTTLADLAERCPVRGRQSLPRGHACDT